MAPTARDELRDNITIARYKLAGLIARMTPAPMAAAAATGLGATAAFSLRSRRAIIERHLQRVDPSLSGVALRRAASEAFDSYIRYYFESFRLPALSDQAVNAGMVVDGFDHVTDALDKGNGAILALPHLGGWEWAGRWLAQRVGPITVVVEAIEPQELFDWFAGMREDGGMRVVALGPSAGSAVIKALRDNQVVCLLCDRDIQGGGVEVEFFGERTTLPAGPATIGLRTGAPILPAAVYFTDRPNGHRGIVRPPVDTTREGGLREDVARVTQRIASELEVLIRRAPEQWHLFVPNWPSDPGFGKDSHSRM